MQKLDRFLALQAIKFLDPSPDKVAELNALIDEIKNDLLIAEHIKDHLKKIDQELDDLYNGVAPRPASIDVNNPLWADIVDERIEWLEGLQSTLSFAIQYPARQQVV